MMSAPQILQVIFAVIALASAVFVFIAVRHDRRYQTTHAQADVTFDRCVYRDPASNRHFLVATISTTEFLGEPNALDRVVSCDRLICWLDGREELSCSTATDLRSRRLEDHADRT